jgi:predicted metalloprotease with PDZ domain
VREYERHVESVTAKSPDGRELPVVKTRKNRWRLGTGGAPTITMSYRVYGREMTVRNNWIEAGFAMINGAPTFITLADRVPRPHDVRIELPAAWKTARSPLMPVAGAPNTFRAADFDELVDSPLIAGNPVIREFEVGGKKHYLVLEGDTAFFDADRAAAERQEDRRGRGRGHGCPL